ncbi:MAG: ABC transporter permease [Bacteroides sp.]|nr:ABC transporter permease [Bacteroides sp.]
MIGLYLKQAWQLLRQNRLYSCVYIIGTGLAIALTMILVLIYYIKLTPVYPEPYRDRTVVFEHIAITEPRHENFFSGNLSYKAVREYFYPLQSAEVVSAFGAYLEDGFIELPETAEMVPAQIKYTDTGFWKMFDFQFLAGHPFTEADFQSGICSAVLSESLAHRIFGSTDVAGRYFSLNFDEYRVSGVVKDASFATPSTFAQLWIPFTANPDYLKEETQTLGLRGYLTVYILAPSRSAIREVKQEIDEIFRKINSTLDEYEIDQLGYPETYRINVFRENGDKAVDWKEVLKNQGIILLALLLVPAVNLAGMISSRIEKRLPELGIRKAFGVSRKKLLEQLLVENLFLTCLGGLLGLLLSYLLIWYGRNWILSLFDAWPDLIPEGVDTYFTPGMLFSPIVFGITFCVCVILNFFSALFPALRGLNREIVASLHDKN